MTPPEEATIDEAADTVVDDDPAASEPTPVGHGMVQDNVSEPGVQTTHHIDGTSSSHGAPVEEVVAEDVDPDDTASTEADPNAAAAGAGEVDPDPADADPNAGEKAPGAEAGG